VKTLLITGAAQGIGLATAKRYAAQGWFVGIYDVNRDAIASHLETADFPNACGDYCDVTDYDSIAAMIEHFSSHTGGRLDLLVNNAGVLSTGRFEDIDHHAHQTMVDVNMAGATHTLQLAYPLLQQTPRATVVNLCSASSIHGIPRLAVYSASKFYINGLTEALALEWKDRDIRVTSVKPPVINTSMGQTVANELPQKMPVKLTPEGVAREIQLAAQGSGGPRVMGLSTKLWYWLDKLLPGFLRDPLCNYLSGAKQAATP
jgi:NAD(P)-dependent dehydrogenase (short-subunit alcohol dehydrogenase family)